MATVSISGVCASITSYFGTSIGQVAAFLIYRHPPVTVINSISSSSHVTELTNCHIAHLSVVKIVIRLNIAASLLWDRNIFSLLPVLRILLLYVWSSLYIILLDQSILESVLSCLT